MAKWEYITKQLNPFKDVGDVYTEMGDEGWEAWHQDMDYVYFKRPIEEEAEYTPTNIFPEPDRVVINDQGESVPGWKAHLSGVYMGAIFIRDDGWSLGAHPNDVDVAESLWPDKWVAVMVKTTIMSYETYKQQKAEGRKFF